MSVRSGDGSPSVAPNDDALAGEAMALAERAETEPTNVLAETVRLLAVPAVSHDTASVLWRARSVAARVLDRVDEAIRCARRAVDHGQRAGSGQRVAEARVTLALALFNGGRSGDALRQLDTAEAVASGATMLRVMVQRALLFERLGRIDEALALYDRSVAHPDAHAHRTVLLTNRGIALTLAGRIAEAIADLDEVCLIEGKAGPSMGLVIAIHNVGFARTLEGNIAEALHCFDEADALGHQLGLQPGRALMARARALVAGHLLDEAVDAAMRAAAEFESIGATADLAETRLMAAEANLRRQHYDSAIELARSAQPMLRRQQRLAHVAFAEHIVVRAQLAKGRHDGRLLATLERCIDQLDAVGLQREALAARLTAGQLAADLGRHDVARGHLETARRHRTRGPLVDRVKGWHAEALVRIANGDRPGAKRAVGAGIDAVRDLQRLAGDAELQAAAAGSGVALADLGLALALDDGDAWSVLRWVERWRAGSLGLGVRAASDAALAGDLAALRAANVRAAELAGDEDDRIVARRTVADIESRIRARARHAAGAATAPTEAVAAGLRARLLGRALVNYFEFEGDIGAIVVTGGRAVLHRSLGVDIDALAELGEASLFALRRLAVPGRPAAARRAAAASLADVLARLDAALVASLPRIAHGHGPLLVCPTGALLALPWSGLPSLQDRAVSVVPSMAAWRPSDLDTGATRSDRTVLVAGPGLVAAPQEIDALARVHLDAATFQADDATVERVLASLDGVSLAHFACHGHARSDNPSFSSLTLADGPLTVYDLGRLSMAPAVVVLAACEVGASAVRAGEELLGLTSALMRAGTASVIASVVSVADEAAVPFMVRLHEGLRDGVSPSAALLAARRGLDRDDAEQLALGAAFTCFGA